MRIKLEGKVESEDQLPEMAHGRHSSDVGRTWWTDAFWFIWTGTGWQKALATNSAPGGRK